MSKFTPLDLSAIYNSGRGNEPIDGRLPWHPKMHPFIQKLPGGKQVFWGIPFSLGAVEGERCWLVLGAGQTSATIPITDQASYIIFAHFTDASHDPEGHGQPEGVGLGLVLRPGEHLADYSLTYTDGSLHTQAIRRRFEVNEAFVNWGHQAFNSRPHRSAKALEIHGPYPAHAWGYYQTGVDGGGMDHNYWIYALPNPHPEKQLSGLRLEATGASRLAIAGITLYHGQEHPLRHRRLEAMRIQLPKEEAKAPDQVEMSIDLGIIARKYAVPAFDSQAWLSALPRGWGEEPQPPQPVDQLIAEVTANPEATLTVAGHAVDLQPLYTQGKAVSRDDKVHIELLTPRQTWLHVTVEDASTGLPTPARVHFRAPDGRYLPPYGHRHEVNDNWFEDYGGDLKLGTTQYAYVDGSFQIELPIGEVYVELSKGFEYRPLREKLTIAPGQRELKLRLERPVNLRGEGWVTADTHVHFISPQTAVLQAQGEGVNLVNLLASQWGDLFTNVADITGDASGVSRDDTIVWVGTENRQHILGHISMLGTKGNPVFPMCASGANESYLGDPTWMSLADWADLCREREGVVIAPHFPNPYAELAADIILGKLDGAEIRDFSVPSLDTYSVTEWYRFLNLGYRLTAVGGTDKMSAGMPVGGVRTYAYLGEQDFTFANWGKAVRAGRTFTSSGPLLSLSVEGHPIGDEIRLPKGGGTLEVEASAVSTQPFHKLEIVVNGQVVGSESVNEGTLSTRLHTQLHLDHSSWIAARCLSHHKVWHIWPIFMAAHTSPIYVKVADQEMFSPSDAAYMLTLIEGGMAWLDTLSIPADPQRQAHIRGIFQTAGEELNRRMHTHTPLPRNHG